MNHCPCSIQKDAPIHALSQPWSHSHARKEKVPPGWERHLQDGLNITGVGGIFSLGATLREHPASSAPGKPPLRIPNSLLLHSCHTRMHPDHQCSSKRHLIRLLSDKAAARWGRPNRPLNRLSHTESSRLRSRLPPPKFCPSSSNSYFILTSM